MVLGSIADEESPFNECAHAFLSAGRALLLHLREASSADHKAVDALIGKIELEMLINGASLTMCRYSDEPFNIIEVIFPRWSDIPPPPPAALPLFVVIFGLGGACGPDEAEDGVRPRDENRTPHLRRR
jgi:hypothetical protein